MVKGSLYYTSEGNWNVMNSLLVKELRGCDAEIFLKLPGEVLGIFEAETFGGFGITKTL